MDNHDSGGTRNSRDRSKLKSKVSYSCPHFLIAIIVAKSELITQMPDLEGHYR